MVAAPVFRIAGAYDVATTFEVADQPDHVAAVHLDAIIVGSRREGRFGGYVERIGRADAFVVITPEYNHGDPASLKQAIDVPRDEWRERRSGSCLTTGQGGCGSSNSSARCSQSYTHRHDAHSVSFAMAWDHFDQLGEPATMCATAPLSARRRPRHVQRVDGRLARTPTRGHGCRVGRLGVGATALAAFVPHLLREHRRRDAAAPVTVDRRRSTPRAGDVGLTPATSGTARAEPATVTRWIREHPLATLDLGSPGPTS